MADGNALEGLTHALRRLPGVGAKSAARMAFHLLQHDTQGALQIARALEHAVHHVRGSLSREGLARLQVSFGTGAHSPPWAPTNRPRWRADRRSARR